MSLAPSLPIFIEHEYRLRNTVRRLDGSFYPSDNRVDWSFCLTPNHDVSTIDRMILGGGVF